MTVNEFVTLYREFEKIDPDFITLKLGEAAILELASEWGDELDYAIGLRTAALLKDSPIGLQTMQSGSKNNEGNKYKKELEERRKLRHKRHHVGFIGLWS